MKTRSKHFPTATLVILLFLLALGACTPAAQGTEQPTGAVVPTEPPATSSPGEAPSEPTATPETDESSPTEPTPEAVEETVGPPSPAFVPGNPVQPLHTYFFDGVITADVEAAGSGTVYLALGRPNGVIVRSSVDGGATLSKPVVASGGAPLFARNIERPSIAVDENGRIGLTWLEGQPNIKVWHAESSDGGASFTEPRIIDQEEEDGMWLPRIAVDGNFNSYFAWIEGGTLVFAAQEDGEESYTTRVVDESVCECCPPDPVVIGDRMYIAYRDRALDDQERWVRDIHVTSAQMGDFDDWREVRVSDAPWVIDVCPLSGPVLVEDGTQFYALWMDGRNDEPNSFNRSDIWLAISNDNGSTFSENIRLNSVPGAYNNKPVAVVGPDGRLHIVWQAEEGDRGVLYYTYSDDGGETFATPFEVAVNVRGDEKGMPGNAQISVDEDGRVYLLWVDRTGAFLWVW